MNIYSWATVGRTRLVSQATHTRMHTHVCVIGDDISAFVL